ncbi:hypothetical protein BCV70DRAFT_94486 [Testicularia cyperi]|uniref:Uncharacterized protein n=1 Tax=Testicularia cyperi TaxID=1882483 RepID=A0A317XSQ5_9BASI|nr:hypothetical protein BCV70DRAFT_94486 [Testicularia cyperi]
MCIRGGAVSGSILGGPLYVHVMWQSGQKPACFPTNPRKAIVCRSSRDPAFPGQRRRSQNNINNFCRSECCHSPHVFRAYQLDDFSCVHSSLPSIVMLPDCNWGGRAAGKMNILVESGQKANTQLTHARLFRLTQVRRTRALTTQQQQQSQSQIHFAI